jgi:hypothetical protein
MDEFERAHIHRGGTGITNFRIEQRPVYEEALKRHGVDEFTIGEPMRSLVGQDLSRTCLALRSKRLGRFPESISDFWGVLEKVRAEMDRA